MKGLEFGKTGEFYLQAKHYLAQLIPWQMTAEKRPAYIPTSLLNVIPHKGLDHYTRCNGDIVRYPTVCKVDLERSTPVRTRVDANSILNPQSIYSCDHTWQIHMDISSCKISFESGVSLVQLSHLVLIVLFVSVEVLVGLLVVREGWSVVPAETKFDIFSL